MVPVDDVVRVGEVARVLGRQEDGAERGDPPLRALEVVREVLHVVGGLHDGVVHHGAGDVDPAHRVGVDGLERVPVHREVGQRRSLNIAGRREALLRDALVGLLALPVAEADGAERGQGHDEHHERDPEHDPPRAALLLGTPGTGLLMTRVLLVRVAPAAVRPARRGLHGAVGGVLCGSRTVGARLRPCSRLRRSAPRRARLLRMSPARRGIGILSILGHVHLSDDRQMTEFRLRQTVTIINKRPR